MQINRLPNLVFPPTPGQTDAAAGENPSLAGDKAASQPGQRVAAGQRSVTSPGHAKAAAAPAAGTAAAPGVVLKLSQAAAEPSVVYGNGRAGLSSQPRWTEMSLENQLEFGRDHGVFTKIAVNKNGVLVGKAQAAYAEPSPEFARAAVDVIRDFQEGVAALKQQSGTSQGQGGFFTAPLRSLQQVAAKLNVFS